MKEESFFEKRVRAILMSKDLNSAEMIRELLRLRPNLEEYEREEDSDEQS